MVIRLLVPVSGTMCFVVFRCRRGFFSLQSAGQSQKDFRQQKRYPTKESHPVSGVRSLHHIPPLPIPLLRIQTILLMQSSHGFLMGTTIAAQPLHPRHPIGLHVCHTGGEGTDVLFRCLPLVTDGAEMRDREGE